MKTNLAETATWYWLVYESGLGLRRVKEIMLDYGLTHSQSLHEVLFLTPFAQQTLLKLTVEESELLEERRPRVGSNRRDFGGVAEFRHGDDSSG